ncbi:hypothetical protein V502_01552 [Pseudogymnoascus sp. VKM F-4520 (FW-2644)]|nr:hypothetical protein V502_01552 [Pseudogymnoascus sp. VKM F-4520 (FW-2644)]
MAPINVGIVGYGSSAKIYNLPFITPNPDLNVYAFLQRAAIPDPKTATPGSHCTIDFPNAKHYQSADDFFADSNIELVIVCSHPDSHASFAEKALRAGKHVVVEKPFTTTTAEADRVIAIAKESGKILTCYQNRRYDSDFLTLRHLVNKNAFGTVTEFENHYDVNMPVWMVRNKTIEYTPGEGMTFGLGAHSIDQALVLFGKPASVTAFLRSVRGVESEIDDTFTIILQYSGEKKNLLVTIKTAIATPMQDQLKTFVRGTEGSFIKFGTDVQEEQIFAGKIATDEGFGVEPSSTHGLLTTFKEVDKSQTYQEDSKRYHGKFPSIKGNYVEYYEDLVAAIRGERELAVNPQDSRDAIRVIELARESHKTGTTIQWS